MNVTIYGLADPRDGRIRYVGRTVNVDARLVAHQGARTENTAKRSWIAELRRAGLAPTLKQLETCTEESCGTVEQRWISRFRTAGECLLNVSAGGAPRRKHAGHMGSEIKIRLSTRQKQAFEEAAGRMRLSVSAWLRIAGMEKLQREGDDDKKKGGR